MAGCEAWWAGRKAGGRAGKEVEEWEGRGRGGQGGRKREGRGGGGGGGGEGEGGGRCWGREEVDARSHEDMQCRMVEGRQWYKVTRTCHLIVKGIHAWFRKDISAGRYAPQYTRDHTLTRGQIVCGMWYCGGSVKSLRGTKGQK